MKEILVLCFSRHAGDFVSIEIFYDNSGRITGYEGTLFSFDNLEELYEHLNE